LVLEHELNESEGADRVKRPLVDPDAQRDRGLGLEIYAVLVQAGRGALEDVRAVYYL